MPRLLAMLLKPVVCAREIERGKEVPFPPMSYSRGVCASAFLGQLPLTVPLYQSPAQVFVFHQKKPIVWRAASL